MKRASINTRAGLGQQTTGFACLQTGYVEQLDTPNRLNREFATEHPNQVRSGDVTYIWAQSRWHYLATMLDLQIRRVIGWAFSVKPDVELVIKALDNGLRIAW